MDRLTAVRTFGKPSFTPVRHVKLFNDRWYRCTFQKVETDPRVDYVGLAEGEYVELLPGQKAREARNARLNHLNAIEEWQGPVFAVQETRIGSKPTYVGSMAEANALKAKWVGDNAAHLKKALEAIDRNLAMTDEEVLAHYGKCEGWAGNEAYWLARWRDDERRSRERNVKSWSQQPTVKEVKGVPVWRPTTALTYPPPKPMKHVRRAQPRLSK